MAIDPPSDIILEVAKAADPERSAAVARRLAGLSAGGGAATADFAVALNETAPAKANADVAIAGAPNMRARLGSVGQARSDEAKKAQVQFEAVLLNSFVGEMLPKDAPDTYGQGLAGEMWRSMLADQVSRKIAGSGVLGIGERLFQTHPLKASSSLEHVGRTSPSGAASPAQMSANALSAASGADIADGSYLFGDAKSP